MAQLSCDVAELEARWQQWLLGAGGTAGVKELLPAGFTDCFAVNAGLLLSKELASQVSSRRPSLFCHFVDEEEVGLLARVLD